MRKCQIAILAALAFTPLLPVQGHAVVISDLIDTGTGPVSPVAVGATYDSASITVFIDPAATNWMALSIGTNLTSGLPNLAGIPSIQSPQMNDRIQLTVSFGASTTSTTLDQNDAFNQYIGNQAVFFGSFSSVGRFNGSTTATYLGLPETGALTSFFLSHGAGNYVLTVNSINDFSSDAGHGTIYLLRDVTVPVPLHPSTIAQISGLGLLGLFVWRRKRKGAAVAV